jgi:hypothetical protein
MPGVLEYDCIVVQHSMRGDEMNVSGDYSLLFHTFLLLRTTILMAGSTAAGRSEACAICPEMQHGWQ